MGAHTMILNKIQGAPIIFQLIAFSCCVFEKNLYCDDAARENADD
jgi:hypothetical protein